MQLVLDVVTGEDFPAGRSIQLGLTSGAQTHTVFGRNEPAMIHYHQQLLDFMGLSSKIDGRHTIRATRKKGPELLISR